MANIAYTLRSAYASSYSGGLIRIDEARTLDVEAALTAGSGTITIDGNDEALVRALDAYPPLQRSGSPASTPLVTSRREALIVRRDDPAPPGQIPVLQSNGSWEAQPPTASSVLQKDGVTVPPPWNFQTPQPYQLVALGMDYGLRPTVDLDTNFTLGNQDYAVFYPTVDGRVATLFGQSQVSYARNGVHNRFGSGHNITAQTQSPDHFEDGTTSKTFVPGQWAVWEYDSGHSTWKVVQQGLSKQAMDALYAPVGSTGSGGYVTERRVQAGAATVLETMPRNSAVNGAGTPNSGQLRCMLATIPAGRTLSHLTVVSGTVAGASLVNQWMEVRRLSTGALLTPSNDRTTEAWAINTPKTFDLTTPQAAGASDLDVIVALMVNATTVPSFYGANVAAVMAGVLAGATPVLSWNSQTGLTNPASSPTNITVPSSGAGNIPFYVLGT